MTATMTEKDRQIILAVPAANLDRIALVHGAVPASPATIWAVLQGATWVLRGPAERNPVMLQVIPYILVTAGPSPSHSLLAYRRPEGGGESRLLGCSSIGFGGHVELEDGGNVTVPQPDPLAIVKMAALRELAEELPGLGTDPGRLRTLGLVSTRLHPDGAEVDRVHVGVLMHYNACGQTFSAGPEIAEGRFLSADGLGVLPQPELWTRCVAEALAAGAIRL